MNLHSGSLEITLSSFIIKNKRTFLDTFYLVRVTTSVSALDQVKLHFNI